MDAINPNDMAIPLIREGGVTSSQVAPAMSYFYFNLDQSMIWLVVHFCRCCLVAAMSWVVRALW
jgi:hypothetical protein